MMKNVVVTYIASISIIILILILIKLQIFGEVNIFWIHQSLLSATYQELEEFLSGQPVKIILFLFVLMYPIFLQKQGIFVIIIS